MTTKTISLLLAITLLLGCAKQKNESDGICIQVGETPGWTTIDFKKYSPTDYFTIQTPPTGYTGGMKGFEGFVFGLSNTDRSVEMGYSYSVTGIIMTPFGNELASPEPASLAIPWGPQTIILNKKQVFCDGMIKEGLLYYNDSSTVFGRLYWNDNGTMKQAMYLKYNQPLQQEVFDIIKSIKHH